MQQHYSTHILFSCEDLSGIRIKEADLRYSILNSACLYNSNLKRVLLRRENLDGCDLRHANLEGVDFGQYPSLIYHSRVKSISFSKEGQIAAGLENGKIEIFIKDVDEYKHYVTLEGQVLC